LNLSELSRGSQGRRSRRGSQGIENYVGIGWLDSASCGVVVVPGIGMCNVYREIYEHSAVSCHMPHTLCHRPSRAERFVGMGIGIEPLSSTLNFNTRSYLAAAENPDAKGVGFLSPGPALSSFTRWTRAMAIARRG
jgi:hypothetical protein